MKDEKVTGCFYGVGVGPGDPELLTLKTIKIIQQADVIITPKTEKKDDSVALTIASQFLRPDVEIVKMVFPMVLDAEVWSDAWLVNREAIIELLAAGKKVVFLTLGDPMFYSTYMYIYRLLEDSGYPICTVPGITAFCAIGSQLGFPLAEGNETITVIPATASPEKVEKAMASADNVVVMKVYKNYKQIVEMLERNQLATNAVMVSKCGLADEKIVYNLSELEDGNINYLSTILAKRCKA